MIYSIKNGELYQEFPEAPTDGTDYCITPESFDLSLFRVVVGMRDPEKNLIVRTVQVKNTELLLQNQKQAASQIAALGQQVATLTAQNDALGKQVAALSAAGKAGE